MDYAKLNDSIIKKVLAAVALINNPEIDPEIRQLNQEILFREVGTAIYAKVYDMNAFDYEIEHTRGVGIDDRYYGLAKIASGSVSAGSLGLEDQIRSYLDSTNCNPQCKRRNLQVVCITSWNLYGPKPRSIQETSWM